MSIGGSPTAEPFCVSAPWTFVESVIALPAQSTALNVTKPRPAPVVHWAPAFCASATADSGATTVECTTVSATYGVPTYDSVSSVAAEPLPDAGISTYPATGASLVATVNE